MTDERRVFEVGEVLHALVFQLSVADVSLLPLAELGDKPKLHDDGLGDLALQERRAHWMTEPYLCASLPIRPGLQCRCRCCTEDRDGWSQPCPRALCVAVSDQDRCGMCRRCVGGCSMDAGGGVLPGVAPAEDGARGAGAGDAHGGGGAGGGAERGGGGGARRGGAGTDERVRGGAAGGGDGGLQGRLRRRRRLLDGGGAGEEEGGDLRREPRGETGVGWMAAAARRGAAGQGGRRCHFGPKCGGLTGCGGVAAC